MGLRIHTNVPSLSVQRNLEVTGRELTKNYARLSSGSRMASAADDPAGLALGESIKGQVRSLREAERNANDSVSFVQVAEGALNEVGNMLIRLRELSVHAASDTISDVERGYLNTEVEQLVLEIDRIANITEFNGTKLLNGENSKDVFEFQVGIHNGEADRILYDVNQVNATASSLGIDGLSISEIDSAQDALDKIDAAFAMVNEGRAGLGAVQNRLGSTINHLGVYKEALSEAKSRIVDADIAHEASELVKNNILQSAGVAVLAQANAGPTKAIQLL